MPFRYKPSYADNLLSFFLLNLVFIIAYLSFKKGRSAKTVAWFYVIFCVFAFWNTDTATYEWLFYEGKKGLYKESVYYYMSLLCFNSYYLFRTLIWGTATLLYYYTAKNFNLKLSVAFFTLSIFFLLTFSYARASLAMAVYVYGLSLLSNYQKGKKYLIKGAIFILLSPLFHRSYYVIVAVTPFLFIKINKKIIIALLLMAPFISRLILMVIRSFLANQIQLGENMEDFSDAVQNYAGRKSIRYRNWKALLIGYIHQASYFVSLGYILYYFFKKETSVLFDKSMRNLLTITIINAIMATLFLIIGINNYYYHVAGYRFLYMTSIPISIILSYMYLRGILTKRQLFINLALPFIYSEAFFVGKLITRMPTFW